ncbi:hypothetical protein [Pseudoroseicyclus tamaricis]|uniref:DUF7742 domain-containing protein n=1 Tax=Pseudoroseicyclus tamaricis TaxID=2705421 RepID=A0A6B2JHP9_9RHOB|nr:hypothetical protein [Pseudoroseicyclus tamaricis]NDV00841.1 hypothetical protein [Pseudoroseicyclus tamaricis]
MRPVTITDLDLAARALLAAPPEARPALAATMLAEADIADRYRKRLGRLHAYGGGSLTHAALLRPRAPGPGLDDGPYLGAVATLLSAIAARRTHRSS